MNKTQLVEAVAKELKVSKAQAGRIVDSVIGNLLKGIKKGRVALPSLGVFKVKKRKARKGRNPQTGKEIKIPAKKVVTFKATKNIKL